MTSYSRFFQIISLACWSVSDARRAPLNLSKPISDLATAAHGDLAFIIGGGSADREVLAIRRGAIAALLRASAPGWGRFVCITRDQVPRNLLRYSFSPS